jgi:hypothetical protein
MKMVILEKIPDGRGRGVVLPGREAIGLGEDEEPMLQRGVVVDQGAGTPGVNHMPRLRREDAENHLHGIALPNP